MLLPDGRHSATLDLSVGDGETAPPTSDDRPSRAVVLAIIWTWLTILLLTHYGAFSPYSYLFAYRDERTITIEGVPVHRDADNSYSVFLFFYQPRAIDYSLAPNMVYPLPQFVSGNFAAFTRSYLLAHYLTNLFILWMVAYAAVRLAEQLRVPRKAILVAGLTLASLPMYAHYIGQPLQYVVGPAISFLALMAAIALARQGVRDPIVFGLLTAVITLNYDWYVYTAALVLYFMEVHRFENVKRFLLYVIASLAPRIVWLVYVQIISGGQFSPHLKDTYLDGILYGWLAVLQSPLQNTLFPFLAGHVGLTVAIRMVLAMVYWPVVLLVIAALSVLKPRISAFKPAWLVMFLLIFFTLEQFAISVFDWENGPRRALPAVFAAGFALFYAARELIKHRPWRIAFYAVMIVSMYIPMADRITGEASTANFGEGAATNGEVKRAVSMHKRLVTKETLPFMMRNEEQPRFGTLAAPDVDARMLVPFLFAHLFLGSLLFILFRTLARAGLAPARAHLVVAGLLLLTLSRLFF